MRVYEIAKEVGIPNKDLIAKIRALGLEVNNHMSSLDADDVARIKRSLEKEKAGAEKPAQTQRRARRLEQRLREPSAIPAGKIAKLILAQNGGGPRISLEGTNGGIRISAR